MFPLANATTPTLRYLAPRLTPLAKHTPTAARAHFPKRTATRSAALPSGPLSTRKFSTSIETAPVTLLSGRKTDEIYREDYKPTPYLIDTLGLDFDLYETRTTVVATSHFILNPKSTDRSGTVFLNRRDDVTVVSVKVNGALLPDGQQNLQADSLTLTGLPIGEFELEIVTEIDPSANTILAGLYTSGGSFCTQCEAEGFRGITCAYDRPDVMSKYTVRMAADKANYPVLLSNGNLLENGDLTNGRHYALWEDPWPKPCYLFALVAGDLQYQEDNFTTMSGTDVVLRVYTEAHNIEKVGHAMKSLKESMEWDEKRFGREYDLDLFNIVAVDDFNMGAMENKSLNIFNSRFVLASQETATDADFTQVQGVVGHEYFHNWSGDRVTCRDWFQLTLKEGLTVWRDQEFSSDLNSRAVERISNVRTLRTDQFAEDAGPTAHPIRPESYVKMDNFYTDTVYDKGAEVVNIYRSVLGDDGFRKGLDAYFAKYDGQAVTCEDFCDAMATANNKDLTNLFKWYGQAGTPVVTIQPTYRKMLKTFTMKVSQTTPATPGQPSKVPVLIPLITALLGPDGKEMPLQLKGSNAQPVKEMVLEFDASEATYTFTNVTSQPVLSTLRTFSAPVKLEIEGQTDDDLVFLFANDSDYFNKWDAGQRLSKKIIIDRYNEGMAAGFDGTFSDVPQNLIQAFKSVLEDSTLEGRFVALALTLPSESEVKGDLSNVDPIVLHKAFSHVGEQIATALENTFLAVLRANDSTPGESFDLSAAQMDQRALKSICVQYLAMTKKQTYIDDCLARVRNATNMTDAIAALTAMNDIDCSERSTALDEFYIKWQAEQLVVNKWLTFQSETNIPGNVSNVAALMQHPGYIDTNPNCNYAVFDAFVGSPINFHAADGSGYDFYCDELLRLDQINAQTGAHLSKNLTDWRKYDQARQDLLQAHIQELLDNPNLSANSREILAKSLES